MAVLPIKGKIRGPAPNIADSSSDDVIDEALDLYRANCFFRNFEIQGNADRVLIYLLLFIGECVTKIGSSVKGDQYPTQSEALKSLSALAISNFSMPGAANFPLNAVYDKPKDRTESETMRLYMTQLRQELVIRLVDRVYSPVYADTMGGKRPSKWWVCFQKRKFMNKSL